MTNSTRCFWAAVLGLAGAFAHVVPATAQTAIQFDGVNDYVTLGAAPSLGASTFTLEVRFKRTATGVGVSTGTGGLTLAVPLLTKGRGEAETPANLNMNYFLGINNSGADATVGVLCADFENNSGGGNNRVFGVTAVPVDNIWHHAAATYDGTTWRLYLDGNLEATLVVSQTPEASSIQHAGLGTAMTSGGTAAGFFAGMLDEARIWNVVRSQTDIQTNQNVEIQSAPGLIGHWALNEGSGTGAGNSVASGANGTLTNGPLWTTDATVALLTATGLRFGGSATGYVTFGDPAALDLAQFTAECWFRRDGAGTPNSTGTGGVTAVPLVAHGGPEAETPSNLNMNYFLGIRSDGVLCADFEEGAAGSSPGLNHPVSGTTAISNGVWYHAAATYDGTTWRLFLNGNLEATLVVGQPVESGTIQRASLGTTLTSGGVPAATPLWFNGAIDEARIWNSARSQADIISTLNTEITGAVSGLVARWGLNEDALTTVSSSAGGAVNGTLTGTNWSWASGSPFNAAPQPQPAAPSGLTATAISTTQIDLNWTDVATTETSYEVERSTTGIGGTYTLLVTLPAGSTSYSNTGLSPSTEYCYRVRAMNAGGGSAYDGPACATTQSPVPPVAPTDLVATATSFSQVHLAWTDNATNETGYEVERSTTGIGGSYSLVTTLGVGAVAYDDLNRSPVTEYCYRVRAINGSGASAYAGPTCATTPGSALDFGSAATTYVTFGDPAALDLAQFTVECWFRRDGAGAAISTGGSGVVAVPLVTHGAPQADGSNVDMNYFLGIRSSDGVLCADFEEGVGGTTLGLNHPVAGVTPVGSGWHHAAATYDGTTWRLYLDGNLEATLAVGQPVRSNSIQHAALATALTSTGGTNGFLDGVLDEVRVWSVVRTQSEIQSSANTQITTPIAGLAARWSLDEGAGTAVNGSAGTTVNGTITGANFAWTGAAPFNLSFTPPDAPAGLGATAVTHSQVTLSWTDLSTNEAGFEIQRSTTGIGGTYSPLVTVAPNTTTYASGGLSASTEYCYRVRAVNGSGVSAYAGPACATTPAFSNTALGIAGSTAQPTYASFGNPAALQLSTLTIEMWLRRDGAGEGTNTGTGGFLDVIPLVAKGRAESETATTDINYLLGIRASSGALCADFEEGAAGASPSLNHPIEGTTSLAMGTWYHVAATYDGSSWKLYLNGVLDASVDIGQPIASASTVAVALGSALTSTNVAAGFFNGVVDEVRIWNVARDQAQIQATANAQIAASTPGLVARWSLDEGSGAAIGGSAGTTVNGTITGPNYAWSSPGAPFNLAFNQQPAIPVLVAPANGATGVPTSPSLQVTASDPEGGNLTVTYYGRAVAPSPGADFTLIGLPDTQYYSGELNGGTNAIFQSQTNWIVANRVSRNITYVGQLGDCVEHGDNGGNDIEWQRADASLGIIENSVTTGLPQGIPFGVCVGNHDQSPIGDAAGTTTYYNQYFGTPRFSGRTYYGGHYGSNNDNWYDLFSASGMDFIVIAFEYDTSPDAPVLSWADNLLTTYSNRRAIVMSHFICNTGNPAGYGPQGQATYDALKSHANLDLMLCGHVPGEGRRQDTFNGNTVHTMLSDYQSRTNGGNGWLRILEFSPANNEIRVKTYSPWLNQFENDSDSEFTLPYDMASTPAFQAIGTVAGVPSGSNGTLVWSGRAPGTAYEWYATVSDGAATTVGPVWSFTTTASTTYTLTATAGANGTIGPSGAVVVNAGANQPFTFTPAVGYHVSVVTVDASAVAVVPSYTFTNVQADHTIDVQFAVNPAVAPVANLGATQVVPGTAGQSTTAIQLAWDATPVGTTVEVWRKGFGSYPEYDDAGGAAPTASASYPPGAGWVKVDGLDMPGETDLVAGRDVIYYVAYARDGLGTWSPTSAMTAGTLNYHLGDVSNGLTEGEGNNKVYTEDLSLLGTFYGATGGAMAAVNYLDVGPTTTQYVDGRPMTDDQIEFEDLVMFAINHGLGQTGPGAPVARRAAGTSLSSSGDELVVEAPSRALAGEMVTARLKLRGSGALIAVSARLEWDPAVVEPVGHAAGAWLREQGGQVFSPAPGAVDAAVMAGQGMAGEGELATVSFRVLSAGDPKLRIAALAGRDSHNRAVTMGNTVRPPARVVPETTRLEFARPNPFQESVTLGFDLASRGPVELAVYGVDGRKVRTLVQETREPGKYEEVWDGRDDHGAAAGAGVYYARLVTSQGRFSRRVTNLK